MRLASHTVDMPQLYQIINNTKTGSFYHQLRVTYVYHLPYKYLTKILSPRDSRKNHSFIPLACAERDNSLPFSGASSIPVCYIRSPSTLFHQLVFQPPSLHLAIYFLVFLLASLFPNSCIILFLGILFSSILCTRPNQRNYNLLQLQPKWFSQYSDWLRAHLTCKILSSLSFSHLWLG